ncbi:MAG: Rha family transcriptional regulator [Methylobacillus sp.]|jgi:phage regulator Rha-like protein|nr:Rha family transcriptional regulator [Methylobacillus sp.]
MNDIALIESRGEARVDSRTIADQLGIQHKNVRELLTKFSDDFKQFGILPFQTEKLDGSGRGRSERFALLNEDQAYLLLTFTRNTAKVRALKVKLVQAFRQARSGQVITALEYLPGYHELHDRIHELAKDSANEKFVHMNLNKLVNKTVGIESGQRSKAPLSALAVAQTVAVNAMSEAKGHHDGYEAAKRELGKLQTVLIGSVG